ncbi:MAG TPA: BPL-N domain-containing protein [Candidatus Sulfotelmatobacter sp.]|nr:BPL-N domain-containing protein [Candidatus Sulfotelmatobacter sp.]
MHSFLRPSCHSQRFVLVASMAIILIGFTACGTPGATVGSPKTVTATVDSAGTPSTTSIILFNGTGTSSSDVSAVEAILTANNLGYITKNSSQIEAMSESQLAGYKLLIVPGGNSITIGDNLTTAATTNIHNAVTKDGMHYLGICAGGFFGGYSIYNGLNLTSGVWFNFYEEYDDGYHKLAVNISAPTGSPLDQYWQDGPEFTGWGSIVGKYPDGTPAIVEGSSGNGWVILSGVHPEAPASWRTGMTFTTSVATDNAYAGTLILAALNRTTLSHY